MVQGVTADCIILSVHNIFVIFDQITDWIAQFDIPKA